MSEKFASTIAGATILITGVGLVSKGFGFLREIVYANNFGLHSNFDIYLIGAVLPITLNTSVIYLAQNYFIPAYHNKLSLGKDKAEKFFSNTFWLFVILAGIFSIILFLISPFLIKSYLTNTNPQVHEAVLKIFNIFLLTIPLNAGFSILSAYFQSEYNFKAPAISSLFQNIIIILLVLVFTGALGVLTIPIGYLFGTIDREFAKASPLASSSLAVNNRVSEIDKKLGVLLDGFVNQIIGEEEYKLKKTSLLSERMTLKEKQAKIDGKGKIWLELARTIVTSAGQANYIAREGSFEEKREFVKKIGSNFRLAGATLLFSYNLPYNFLAQKLKYEKWGSSWVEVLT